MNLATSLPDTMTIHVPFRLVKRGGRKEMQLPEAKPAQRRPDEALVMALARAFRWKRMLDSGEVASAAEIAQREGIARSYVARLLQLTLLAPDIVQAILDGLDSGARSVEAFKGSIPLEWSEQRQLLRL